MKLKTWFASLALVLSAAACGSDTTGVVDPGPPPPLPAGAVTVTTGSGLQYVDVAVGSGGTVAQSGNRVRVRYTGWLTNNKFFDTSVGGPPLEFILGQKAVIDGFDEGIRGMRPGGKRRLIIPPSLGYGSQPVTNNAGVVVIPANSTLIFDVELLTVS